VHNVFDLTDRVVMATGGNSGIGLGFLVGCAKQGADIVIWDRDDSTYKDALLKLKAAGAKRVHFERVDVSDEATVIASFVTTVEAMGGVHCVFANAGITSRASSFPDMTSEMYHQLLAVNLHGAFYTLREAARHMRTRFSSGDSGGSLVVCGSLSIYRGLQGMEHYAGAKGALSAMVKSMATELGQFGIRVNMIAPGFILSGMTANDPRTAEHVKRMSELTPLGRPGTPEDIEGPAAYLASEASRFQTGDTLIIDGGRMATL
jgi:NAD(P)-dependent dehydrogenase (short-subunit alcohol dehydrogenase family)